MSVRSGAKFSMPGMMETVLNVGLNDASVHGLTEISGDARFARDSYRRLIAMFGRTVLDIEGALFADAMDDLKKDRGITDDVDLTADDLDELIDSYKKIVQEQTGKPFPQHPREQLDLAMKAVFDSWNTERARLYRRRERIPHDLGTAVNVCTMVFGNLGGDSGTGVCFTRDPASGKQGHYGDYLPNAQGEDVVAGIRNTLTLDDMAERDPKSAQQLFGVMRRLETHYRDLCDIEFTVERGKLWMLQTRVGKRTAGAAFRIAAQLVDEQLITLDEALTRVTGEQLARLMFPQFDPAAEKKLLAKGLAASPGAAVGAAVFDSAVAVKRHAAGESVVLVRRETNPDDLEGMIACAGVLTSRGGKTSHAAVVARGMGRTCVCGAEAIDVDVRTRTARVGDVVINEGDVIAIDGTTGEVFLGDVPVVTSPVVDYLEHGLDATLAGADGQGIDEETADLVRAVDTILTHADAARRLRVRANADTADDAARARRLGAQGIGLCRTEHMFLGDRRVLDRAAGAGRLGGGARRGAGGAGAAAARRLRRAVRGDGRAAGDRPAARPAAARVPARPHRAGGQGGRRQRARGGHRARREAAGRGRAAARVQPDARAARCPAGVDGAGPVRDAGPRGRRGGGGRGRRRAANPQVEIMVPLVGSVMELHLIRDQADTVLAEVAAERGCASTSRSAR